MRILLRKFRKAKNLTQEQLAELTNVSQSAISRIERGEVSPSADELEMLARGLKIKIPDLMDTDLK